MSIGINALPAGCGVWVEIDGKQVAVVQGYSCKSTRTARPVEAFGEDEPVAVTDGPPTYRVELTRLRAADGAELYGLKDFSLVICGPDRRVTYSGCRWSDIEESAGLRGGAAEKLTLVARSRTESREQYGTDYGTDL